MDSQSVAENETLYVGVDDSNHAGKDRRGEIVLAVFSYNHGDSIVTDFPNRRECDKVLTCLEAGKIDYRFTILTHERLERELYNITLVSPLLVRAYISDLPKPPSGVKLYLDGKMEIAEKRFLREEFSDFSGFVVDNFTKKIKVQGRVEKHPHCPRVVYMADCLANYLFSQTAERLLTQGPFNNKFVSIDLEKVFANGKKAAL